MLICVIVPTSGLSVVHVGWDVGMKCASNDGCAALKVSRNHWNKLIFKGGPQASLAHPPAQLVSA
jgi:hypothetical protein